MNFEVWRHFSRCASLENMPPHLCSDGIDIETLVHDRAGDLAPRSTNLLGSVDDLIRPLFSGLFGESKSTLC